MMAPDLMRRQLILALRKARLKPLRKDEIEPGKLTNENGSQVEAPSYPANYWPSDGDHS
jgi:hypothetical protein